MASMLFALAVPPVGRAEVPPCSGDNGTPDRVVTGTFDPSLQGAYVLVPFDVAAGSTSVRVKICYGTPELPMAVPGVPYSVKHTLDLGIYQTRGDDGVYDEDEFRGWGGSSRPNVLITPEESTTVGFKPGPIPPGEWAAEIGVAAIAGLVEGDTNDAVDWRLEIFTGDDPADADDPWEPAPYDETVVNPNAGWYKGDFHVHGRHSNPNDATMSDVFSYAFGDAGLDFITLSDYVTDRHWDEIGRFQPQHPGKLIVRSAEVITYRGHINNHASQRYVDYRTGPIYERREDGSLAPVRDAQPASRIFDDIHAPLGPDASPRGWTQVNHPTIFPGRVPTFANFCRGCSWSYSDAETDWTKVDAFEVHTGPAGLPQPEGGEVGPNPFTVLALAWYDHLRSLGYDITAVGASDSHKAGAPSSLTDPGSILRSPIGEGTTVVFAPELSERGIRDGIRAGHAYVKFFSPSGPDVRFDAAPVAGGPSVMMGDELAAPSARFTARVFNVATSIQPRVLLVLRNGLIYRAFPVLRADQTFTFTASQPGDYRLQLMRGSGFEAMTNPITLKP
ncbi:MAG TPA: CehA/McbA family metallohydrolase [Actinomycetota bacterium]|nr:CehA/McbA family metallohydrolase [Actinomycetota bacterium]